MHERTSIGLDVHARSVKSGVHDGLTGEVKSLVVAGAEQPLCTTGTTAARVDRVRPIGELMAELAGVRQTLPSAA
jgi:hypothetical protein